MIRGRGHLIISSLFLVTAACLAPIETDESTTTSAVYTATVTASPSVVELGQQVTASWTAPAEHFTSDYVTLAKVGTPDNSYITYKYVGAAGQTSGELVFVLPLTPALDPGPYEFRYFSTGVKLATSNPITGYADYALTDTPGRVELGQTAQVTWHAPLAHPTSDYVTLAKVGTADNSYITYQYVGHAGERTGTMTFVIPLTPAVDPGPYEFRYFYGGVKRATSPSIYGVARYSITGTPGSVELGQQVSGTWHAPLAHPTSDYVTLAKSGTPDNSYITYQYVGHAGERTGTMTFTVPLTPALDPGPYELRYFYGGVKRATSPSFTGYANYTVAPAGACLTGQLFDATWTAPLAHPTSDYIGIFTLAGGLVAWRYVGSPGLGAGSVTFTGPAPGSYELRYMFGGVITATAGLGCSSP